MVPCTSALSNNPTSLKINAECRSDVFNVYIKGGIGVGLSQTDAVSSGQFSAPTAGLSTGLYLALGGEFKLTNNLQLVVEDYGMLPFIGDYWGNINVMGAGLKYNF